MGRFKEEFGEAESRTASHGPKFLSRLHLTMPKRTRGSSKGADGSQNGMPSPSPTFPRMSGSVEANIESRYPDIPLPCQSAAQADIRRRSADAAGRSSHRLARLTHGEPAILRRDRGNGSQALKNQEHGPMALSPTDDRTSKREDEDCNMTLKRVAQSLEDWSRQLQGQEVEAKRRSQPVVKSRAVIKPTETPEYWAKYSSPRDTRTRSAGLADSAIPRELGGRSVSADGGPGWLTDKPEGLDQELRLGPRALSNRFGKAIKTGISKFISRTRSISIETRRVERRKSSGSGGQMEYPELDLPPARSGYKERRFLGREIDTLGGIEGSSQRVSFGDGSSACEVPVTPRNKEIRPQRMAERTKDSTTTAAGDKYATPPSRMSEYNDAVSHRRSLLDDADTVADVGSIKSDSTVARKARSNTVPNLTSVGVGQTKFMTWSGRARTQPTLMQSTLEFGAELEKLLQEETDRMRRLACSLEVPRSTDTKECAL